MEIVWLGQGECQDCVLVGGKGANLCHLAAAYRAPPAFCLTASAFGRWRLQAADGAAPFPRDLYAPLAAAYQRLGELCGVVQPRVAVRSSALGEDGHVASFAGQHATYLNVRGVEAVVDAVLACWRSVQSPHAIAYRRRQGLRAETEMAVLVQQLIPADASVVVFSANPVTGNRAVCVINANWGLGESIVGGSVTPDTYVVRKADLAVQQRQIADKSCMTVPAANGVQEIQVPRWLRRQPALNEDQIVEMARLVIMLEAGMGWPVDVECVYRHGELYLLQCRPITTGMKPRRTT
ncbi:MAG: PEP/pyruvate-binding domain-containing protein [Caldilineaceae bacterium]|nr:PEP/pyruvate-binding domain-containing protein [Caldilineaceae bacterium]